MNLPFARELWVADGASLLSHVNVPSLVIIGKKDIHVDWEEDGEPLVEASQGLNDVTLVFPENANHILKYEPQERQELSAPSVMPRYNAEDTHLDAETMDTLIHWLSAHTS